MNRAKYSKHHPYVGIAIVCWNNEDILPQCLDSINQQTYRYIKTIIIDNNSSDSSVGVIKRKYQSFGLIESSVNTGFAKGNNIIIDEFMKDKAVEYVVLLNSDASLDARWVEELVNFVRSKSNTAFLQGLTLDYYDHRLIDSTHIFINRKGQAIQGGYRQPKTYSPTQPQKVLGVNAAACMVTKDFLKKQPFPYLFDEDFFMYLEDVDIAARATVLGWDSYFVPGATAYHMGSASSEKNPGYSVYMVNRNRWPLLVKNLPASIIMKMIPQMITGDIRELYRIARGNNFLVMKKFITGRVAGFFMAFNYVGKRRKIMQAKKVSNKNLWLLMKTGAKS